MGGKALAVVLALAGCAGDKETETIPPPPTDTGTTTTTDTAPTKPGPDLVIAPSNVYSVSPSYRVDDIEVRSEYDVLARWIDLTTDGWGEPVEPVSLDVLVLLEILAKPEEIAGRLEADDLGNDLISTWTAKVAGIANANLSDLTGGASTFDPATFFLENPDKSWVLAVGHTDGERLDLRAAVTLIPSDAPDALTQADIEPLSSEFSYSASLQVPHLETATGWELYTVDWSSLTTDALGKEYDSDLGDELFVARFDEDLTDLQQDVLGWEALADAWYTMDVEREDDARLDLARDPDGATFPGFTEGTWLVGVRCTTCSSPFPLWTVVVDVGS